MREDRKTGMDLYKMDLDDLLVSKINFHQGAVAINKIGKLACSTHYSVYSVNREEVLPEYLTIVLRSDNFLRKVCEAKSKGIKNEAGTEFISSFDIPLPLKGIQEEIITSIEKQTNIINSIKTIEASYTIDLILDGTENLTPLGEAVISTRNGWSPVCDGGDQAVLSLSCLQNGRIDFSQLKYTSESISNIEKYYVKRGDFYYSRGNTKELVALAAIAHDIKEKVVYPDLLTKVEFDTNKILPEYAVYLFNSNIGRKYFGVVPEGASPSMVKVSQDYMRNFKVPYMGDIDKQREIIDKFDKQIQALTSLRLLKRDAEEKINTILLKIWK